MVISPISQLVDIRHHQQRTMCPIALHRCHFSVGMRRAEAGLLHELGSAETWG